MLCWCFDGDGCLVAAGWLQQCKWGAFNLFNGNPAEIKCIIISSAICAMRKNLGHKGAEINQISDPTCSHPSKQSNLAHSKIFLFSSPFLLSCHLGFCAVLARIWSFWLGCSFPSSLAQGWGFAVFLRGGSGSLGITWQGCALLPSVGYSLFCLDSESRKLDCLRGLESPVYVWQGSDVHQTLCSKNCSHLLWQDWQSRRDDLLG